MAQFAHANVCRMIGIVRQDDPIMLVLELLPNGSLYNWLRAFKNRDERPDNTVFIRMALDVAKGMKYLSDLSFIHRGQAMEICQSVFILTCRSRDSQLPDWRQSPDKDIRLWASSRFDRQ